MIGKIMKKFAFKKRFITLVEMMIVMFLIAMITGVIAYNYTGSLEEGKAFKTKAGIDKIKTVLALAASDSDIESVKDKWQVYLNDSPLVKNPEELAKDGWGVVYQVTTEDINGEKELVIKSEKYEKYSQNKKSSLFGKD